MNRVIKRLLRGLQQCKPAGAENQTSLPPSFALTVYLDTKNMDILYLPNPNSQGFHEIVMSL